MVAGIGPVQSDEGHPAWSSYISVEDATGLKTKSPIKSLGLQVGYLHSVELTETHVRIGVCITARDRDHVTSVDAPPWLAK